MTTLPATMTAIAIAGKGGPEVLRPRHCPLPAPGPGQVLIKVAAAGVNRPDVLQRKGSTRRPRATPRFRGSRSRARSRRLGAGVQPIQGRATRVMALVNGGGYAEYCVAAEGSLPAGARRACR